VVFKNEWALRRKNQLFVLPEYTLDGPPKEQLKNWCRENRKFLIVGGKDPAPGNNFYNTAFVISTNGEVVFKQVKSVPIQFFKDGLPAPEQQLWDSPWGRIGICICYDLSYTRVTDRLIRLGAEALIVPTMDVADWGRHQHELHARVATVRAAEYGVPIFRVASSGISQLVDRSGRPIAETGFPGERAIISGRLQLGGRGSVPLDRWLAPAAVGVSGLIVLWVLVVRAPKLVALANDEGQRTRVERSEAEANEPTVP
jgi:apolipoprotein N-acyltransferase